MMNNITIDEVKDILKCSIDETTNMNEAIERTLQHIYLKGWNDAEDVLKQITDEIRQIVDAETEHDETWARGLHYALCVIDKHTKGESE